jgi:membrane-associated phospholipid phosphatase
MIRHHFLFFVFSLLLLASARAQNWDVDLAKDINPRHPNSGYWKGTTNSAYFISAGIPVTLFAAALITQNLQLRRQSLEIAGAILVELAISEAIKVSVNRQRPGEKYPTEIFPYHPLHGKSFPSGHASLAFSAAASLSIQFDKWYVTVPAYLWAASVGYSRIYLGVHYPSDVLGGAAVGVGSAYLAHWLNKKLFQKKRGSGRIGPAGR